MGTIFKKEITEQGCNCLLARLRMRRDEWN